MSPYLRIASETVVCVHPLDRGISCKLIFYTSQTHVGERPIAPETVEGEAFRLTICTFEEHSSLCRLTLFEKAFFVECLM